jgi:hypothetical protein
METTISNQQLETLDIKEEAFHAIYIINSRFNGDVFIDTLGDVFIFQSIFNGKLHIKCRNLQIVSTTLNYTSITNCVLVNEIYDFKTEAAMISSSNFYLSSEDKVHLIKLKACYASFNSCIFNLKASKLIVIDNETKVLNVSSCYAKIEACKSTFIKGGKKVLMVGGDYQFHNKCRAVLIKATKCTEADLVHVQTNAKERIDK